MVKDRKDHSQEINFVTKPLAAFIQYYNKNIPEAFPRASIKALKMFKASHEELFKDSDEWTIDKHRKKLMDWLTANREIV